MYVESEGEMKLSTNVYENEIFGLKQEKNIQRNDYAICKSDQAFVIEIPVQ